LTTSPSSGAFSSISLVLSGTNLYKDAGIIVVDALILAICALR
jgi:hypothetical protein